MISGPGIDTTMVKARTRTGEKVVVPHQWRSRANNLAGLKPRNETYYGSQFTHVAGPSRPVVGQVVDADTKGPISGVVISAGQQGTFFSGGKPYISTVTDAEGNYRLEGLSVGQRERMHVFPPHRTAYLPAGGSITVSLEEPEFRRDFQLKRGVWVRGQAMDDRTGKPVPGRVQYYASRDNAHLESYERFARSGVHHERRTDAEGKFELPVLPGRGIITFMALDHTRYRRGFGSESIDMDAADENAGIKMYRTVPSMLISSNEHVFRQIEPKVDSPPIEVALRLTSGVDVVGRLVDPNGQALSGGVVSGNVFQNAWYPIRGETFKVQGYYPDRPRELFIYHPESDLGAYHRLEGPPPKEFVVQMQPTGGVQGRLVDEDGAPLAGFVLRGNGVPNENFGNVELRLGTDEEGRFLIRGLLPGRKYTVTAESGRQSGMILRDVVVEAGETKDVGSVTLQPPAESVVFSSPAATTTKSASQPLAASSNTPTNNESAGKEAATSAAEDTTALRVEENKTDSTIFGKVVGADGDPVAGAQFYWLRTRVHDLDPMQPRLIATSDESGNYRFNLPSLGIAEDAPASWSYLKWMVVRAPGHGFSVERPGDLLRKMQSSQGTVGALANAVAGKKGVTITLPAAGDPLRGRLVDIDGKPVVGAMVRIRWFTDGDSFEWTRRDAAVRDPQNAEWRARVYKLLATIEPSQIQYALPMAKTDSNGRFELRDIGPGAFIPTLGRREADRVD